MSSEDFFNDSIQVSQSIVPSEIDLEKRSLLFSMGDKRNLAKIDKNQLWGQMVMPIGHEDFNTFKDSICSVLDLMSANEVIRIKLESLILEIIPQISTTDKSLRTNGSGLSSLKYRKGVFLSLPLIKETRIFDLCLNLSHELGHQALITYQNFDRIIIDDHNTPIFSAIRGCKRPAILSFHAMVAILSMLEFMILCRDHLLRIVNEDYFYFHIHSLLENLKVSLRSFNGVKFTSLGNQIMCESLSFCLWSERLLCKSL